MPDHPDRITHSYARNAARQAAGTESLPTRQAALADVLDYISQQESLDSAPVDAEMVERVARTLHAGIAVLAKEAGDDGEWNEWDSMKATTASDDEPSREQFYKLARAALDAIGKKT